MHPLFTQVIESLHPTYEKLINMQPVSNGMFPKNVPRKGVYLFTENGKHLYAGRTDNLKNRYGGHTRPSSGHNSAPFAFKLTRKITGRIEPAYGKGPDSRDGLMLNPEFVQVFGEAKKRIRAMQFRYVEEEDATKQALLEAYCCIVLKTEYNDFENH